MYLIQSSENPILFWSNSMGWVEISNAEIFTKEELLTLKLPMSGEWVKLKEEKSVLTYHKLALIIGKMSESEKLCHVTIYKEDIDEYFPVQSIQPPQDDGVLDEGHPILWVC
jgi:hypothetical protein